MSGFTLEREAQFPEEYQRGIRRAVRILKDAGCAHVFLFGSLATVGVRSGSDIDLAVRGCPKGEFFHLVGKLLLELEHPVDLVDLDSQGELVSYLEEEGNLLQIG